MPQIESLNIQEENDLKKIKELLSRNYRLFLVCIIAALSIAYAANRFLVPVYRISSSVLISEDSPQTNSRENNDYLKSSLVSTNQNFQNELWVLKSSPVIEQTVKNLDLSVSYYRKKGFRYFEVYNDAPFQIKFSKSHVQPVNVRFSLTFLDGEMFELKAEASDAAFYSFDKNEIEYNKENWSFSKNAAIGELIETPDLSFIVEYSTNKLSEREASVYRFEFKNINSIVTNLKNNIEVISIGKQATVVEISMKSTSVSKGINIINELMQVYSSQNLERKNHIASTTINYIESQLAEISDSLSETEDNLQRFRSSNQLLDVTQQSSSISEQYISLQNQLAELTSRKRYYDYVSDYLSKNNSYTDMVVPSSIGIQDQMLNNLISELITAQAQQSNLVKNNQEKNPLVQKLDIQIENLKKTIKDNILAASKSISISIDEMNKRVSRTESAISRLPATERQLGRIERKYKLNDAIYNYLLEKHAEAKITKASNLPDDIVIEPARMSGLGPVFPKKSINYMIALFLGCALPFGFLLLKIELNNKVETQEDIERITQLPIWEKSFITNIRPAM